MDILSDSRVVDRDSKYAGVYLYCNRVTGIFIVVVYYLESECRYESTLALVCD